MKNDSFSEYQILIIFPHALISTIDNNTENHQITRYLFLQII